jgi:hypothetical protein
VVLRFAALSALFLTACATDFAGEEPPREPETTMSTPVPATPVLKATFEPASADCNGWVAEGARSIRSVPARSGSYACKLCADGSRPDFALSREVAAPEPGRYVFRAYTRKRPQNEAPAATSAFVEASTESDTIVVQANETPVRDEWDLLEAFVDVPEGATSLRVQIGTPAASSDQCVLVDDVSIEKL